MRKLKRFMSLSIALLLVVSICMTNIGTSAVYNALDEQYIDTENYTYYIDKDTLNATIIDIKAKTKVFNIPETVEYNNKTYTVDSLWICSYEGFSSDIINTLETINAGKNTERINIDLYLCGIEDSFQSLKTINVPAGSKLNNISLPICPNLKSINLASDSVLEGICISSCPKMNKISLPKTLRYFALGEDAPNLKVKIAKDNKYLKVKGNQILSKDGKTLYDIVGKKNTVTVYKTVKTIDDFAVDNKYLKKLIVGKNVTKFKNGSFSYCNKIKIVIKNKNKAPKIKNYAFYLSKKGIRFYVQNKKVAKSLKKQLKGSKIRKAKILIGKKVIYKNIKG